MHLVQAILFPRPVSSSLSYPHDYLQYNRRFLMSPCSHDFLNPFLQTPLEQDWSSPIKK